MRLWLLLAFVALGAAHVASAAMIPEPIAILQGLDKISARVSTIETTVGSSVQFGSLSITVRDCEASRLEDQPENAAFLQIYESAPGEEKKRLFSGWMFSSSPALSELEHPVYDVTLLGCRAPAAAPAPPPPPPRPEPATPRGKTAR
ncbi:MAG TPA: DUF2155 domain-containing protein [Stellaceae bacterium]|nr:DUF2155 domain-containing protein [Stellaceae bacterium]